ncbi:hypothetical protein RHGRI_012198 [Rhododendron griersonianum]|uniref:Uncharacterized protein n=1 Tax=Rhododendron griersonianum TaxID=479676 RepID=A0AAV6KPH9_9ERIC|nr:hypothetical protein RHGRI_012198 [Rhododendron griersonianum]
MWTVEAATTDDDDLVVLKPAKHIRTESVQMECENAVAREAEVVSVEEQQESLGFDYDFGNISLTTEVDPSGLALASSVPVPIETSEDYGQRCLNPSHISAQNLQNAESLCSGDQESDLTKAPHSPSY